MSVDLNAIRAEWAQRIFEWQLDRAVEVFDNNDEGYRAWIESHPTGHVLSWKGQTAMLHRAECQHIAFDQWVDGEREWTYTANLQVCSDSDATLIHWARRSTEPAMCQTCR